MTDQALMAEVEQLRTYLETEKRQLAAVDAALPRWEGTGQGRIDTINRLQFELAEARSLISELEREGTTTELSEALRGIAYWQGRALDHATALDAARAQIAAMQAVVEKARAFWNRSSWCPSDLGQALAALSSAKDAESLPTRIGPGVPHDHIRIHGCYQCVPPSSAKDAVVSASAFGCTWSRDNQDGCGPCSGEFCNTHGTQPCGCDAAQRHQR